MPRAVARKRCVPGMMRKTVYRNARRMPRFFRRFSRSMPGSPLWRNRPKQPATAKTIKNMEAAGTVKSSLASGFYGLILGAITACAPLDHPANKALEATITFAQPQHLHFSGRGAAAGVMLTSAMGPMGVAIGAAIDEGIAKDIQAALDANGVNINTIVREAFNRAWAAGAFDNRALERPVNIHILQYGFETVAGDAERVKAVVEVEVGAKKVVCVRESNGNRAQLSAIKSDGNRASKMLLREMNACFRSS